MNAKVATLLGPIFFVLLVSAQSMLGQAKPDKVISELVGDWSGESVCVNKQKFPGCKDEVVVYHVTPTKGRSDGVTISMDKIVNEKPEFMGTSDFVYDFEKHVLTTEFKNERVHLVVELTHKDDVLEGTVTSLPDKNTVRQIKVKKNKKKVG